MTDIDQLQAEAKRCLRLAQECSARDIADMFSRMAGEYLRRAAALKQRMVSR
jgi:hypothetical protein